MPSRLGFSFRMEGAENIFRRVTMVENEMRQSQWKAANSLGDQALAALREACPVFRGNLKAALDRKVMRIGRDVEIWFGVNDSLAFKTKATNPTPPSVYVQWVINGRGPVNPKGGYVNPITGEPLLVYSATPSNDDWIYSRGSRRAEPNDFVKRAIDGLSSAVEGQARWWADRIVRVWNS